MPSKSLLAIVLVIFSILILVFSLIAHFNYQKTATTYHSLQHHGITTQAYSIKANCNKGRGLQPTRTYRYEIGQQQYFIETIPENITLNICDMATLGDSITVYYLPDNPYIRLSKQQLEHGQPSQLSYYIFSMLFSIVFLFYWVGTKYSAYKQSQKII